MKMNTNPLVFLDIDGVLVTGRSMTAFQNQKNVENELDNEWKKFDSLCIVNLNEIVEQTKAKIVITSQWLHTIGLGRIKHFLMLAGFRYWGMIFDHYHFTTKGIPRSKEIEHILLHETDPNVPWVVVDDEASQYREWLIPRTTEPNPLMYQHLVFTDYETGLDYLKKDRIIRMIKKQQTERRPT